MQETMRGIVTQNKEAEGGEGEGEGEKEEGVRGGVEGEDEDDLVAFLTFLSIVYFPHTSWCVK
jgi:hypothetical protein